MQTAYRWLTRIGIATSHPFALAAVVAFVLFWLIFDRNSFDWQAAATVATLFMTVFIQRAERRDTQAIHAKLDELLRAEGKARNELTTLDEQQPEEIIEHRDEERARSKHDGFSPDGSHIITASSDVARGKTLE